MNQADLDRSRRTALDRVAASRKRASRFVAVAGTLEGLLLVAIMLVIDMADVTHLLIFLCACLVYAPLVFGMFALRVYMDVSTLRVLTALETGETRGI